MDQMIEFNARSTPGGSKEKYDGMCACRNKVIKFLSIFDCDEIHLIMPLK